MLEIISNILKEDARFPEDTVITVTTCGRLTLQLKMSDHCDYL